MIPVQSRGEWQKQDSSNCETEKGYLLCQPTSITAKKTIIVNDEHARCADCFRSQSDNQLTMYQTDRLTRRMIDIDEVAWKAASLGSHTVADQSPEISDVWRQSRHYR